jgi:hypothetical protein
MKKISLYTVFCIALIISENTFSQSINWKSLKKEQRHIINVNTGADYGITVGAGYGYQLTAGLPVVLNAEYSLPGGRNLSDDFKTKFGGHVRLYQFNNFQFSAKVQGVFRRYQNSFATLLNFGSDMSGIIGYYKPKWFIAGEAGFDKAIVTHFKHSEAYKQNFPSVKDGWYEPATGGNFYYGLQTGFSFRKNDIYLKAGKLITQDFSSTPLLPFYLQVGYNIRF